ncbi:carboxypeptidase-like regulatory domain-containing protein [Hymenobacter sp. BT664]|uniref:Carboxypeptidase-like regulatory domain-containing protein n=1 Tax=Hymenobacter montanus TaxID=2771359 RepID=A0A927BD78_9BACT|nr:carboxypeptidase-like regulatory domain-containing protein [Hymenobacter montanus]MBD2768135.1 carboxypeptidase-like regulatory domain-containing protein [Hymenobacter montanus]
MNYLRLFLLGCCWLGALGMARAQGKLSGVVQDSVTHEPLAFASVFLANTTLGVTTTEQGRFEFSKVPAGTYEVVGSYVGYRLGKQSVTVGPAPQQVTLQLAPTGNQLDEVVVQPAPNKPEDYQRFSEIFLGGTSFSAQCHISNPDQVRVSYDESTGELTAQAKEFVQVDNEALGYRLKYYGLYFSYDEEDQSIAYYGQPVFEEMPARDERQRQQWAANRLTAYTGSFMHFLRSVYHNRLQADGFLAQQVRVAANPRFEQADSQRRALLESRPNGPFTAAERDSLTRWGRMAPMVATLNSAPRPIDSLRRVSPDGKHTYLRFTGELQVCHFGEAPDPRYQRPMSTLGASRTPYPAKRQVSRLKLQGSEAEIQANGSLLNPLEAFNGEYWGFERIGEFLPFDYVPPAPAPAAPTKPR